MQDGMSRGDEVHGSPFAGIYIILIVVFVVILIFAIVQIKVWFGCYKDAGEQCKNTEVPIKKIEEPPKNLIYEQSKLIIIEALIRNNPKSNIEAVHNHLNKLDDEKFKMLLEYCRKKNESDLEYILEN